MNRDIKITKKNSNKLNPTIYEEDYIHDQAAFIPGTQSGLIFENKVIYNVLIE